MNGWNEEFDVVVIGGGMAGLSAALEASLAGANTVVFEKMKISGGNSRISDGGLSAPNNFLQKKHGVEDSEELFIDDMLRAGLGLNHPRLVHVLAEQGAEAIDRTRELGVRYQDRVDKFGGHSAARTVVTRRQSGLEILKAQRKRLSELGVEIRTESHLERLLPDGGRVAGAIIRQGSESRPVRALRAVVLATGGFGADVRFRSLLNPTLGADVRDTNHKGATAEGMIAALEVRAFPLHLSWIQLGPWGCPDEKGFGKGGRFASYSVFPAGIVVDPGTGLRIVNEWGDRRERSEAMMRAGRACIGIVDAQGAKKDPDSLRNCLKTGKVLEFDDVAALARTYSIPEKELEATVRGYNESVERGVADDFGKHLGSAQKVDKPPFYAMRLWPKVHYTPGGLAVDEKARALDPEGSFIPGLYAAGEVCGGVHGASRLGGCALTECLVFGRIAGREAAGS